MKKNVSIDGYWTLKNNVKVKYESYLEHLKNTISRLNNYTIYFFYGEEKIKNLIEDIIKEQKLTIDITFIYKTIEELPTYNKSHLALENFKKFDLEEYIKKYNITEKGIVHSIQDVNKSGISIYQKLFTIWTSKLYLMNDILNQYQIPTEFLSWVDISIADVKIILEKNAFLKHSI